MSHNHSHHQKIEGSNTKWEHQHPNYASMDSAPQTFFYTLTNMLKLQQAQHILEVGCGAGKLLSTVLDLKKPQTTYYATDVSEQMVKQAQNRLKAHFQKYQSQLSFEEWLQNQHLSFDVQNGEKIQPKEKIEFDRIISNMVLCHANDPEKMLRNWHSLASEDCLLGVSLLGDPQKNHLVRGMRQALQKAGDKLPDGNPPYYWYDKISPIVQKSGWQIILEWQQNTLFPFLSCDEQHLKEFIHKKVPEKALGWFNDKVYKLINQDKEGIQVWSKIIIARKKKPE